MVTDLKGKGTEWCIDGREVANNYLSADGEFHIYFTEDDNGNAGDPRVAIRLQQGSIAEVRGVLDKDQNLEGQFTDIAREKYKEFPGNERFEKIDRDVKHLTAIEEKMKRGDDLTSGELKFLYEIDGPVHGFGYGNHHPRAVELRAERNPREDAPLVLECEPNQIAWRREEIKPDTKAYVGPLFSGVFAMENLEHVYTSFPEGRITFQEVILGEKKTAEEYAQALAKDGVQLTDWSEDILGKVTPLQEQQDVELVRLKVSDLGFTGATRYDKLCAKAKELGLELCPAEVGPALRLSMKEQPLNDWVLTAMEPLTDRHGNPHVFSVERLEDGSWLRACDGRPDRAWDPDDSFVFRRRKS